MIWFDSWKTARAETSWAETGTSTENNLIHFDSCFKKRLQILFYLRNKIRRFFYFLDFMLNLCSARKWATRAHLSYLRKGFYLTYFFFKHFFFINWHSIFLGFVFAFFFLLTYFFLAFSNKKFFKIDYACFSFQLVQMQLVHILSICWKITKSCFQSSKSWPT